MKTKASGLKHDGTVVKIGVVLLLIVKQVIAVTLCSTAKRSCFCAFVKLVQLSKGRAIPKTNEIVTHICSCHNFFPLSSVQIIIIPACCLLCVL